MNVDKRYVAVGAVCLTLLVCTLLFTNGSFYIKNLGNSIEQNGSIVNSISVAGDGKVFSKPDVVTLVVTASELAGSSKDALAQASAKIKQAAEVALSNGVADSDIQTSTLNVYPEYDYNSGNPVFKGQRATVSISIKIKGVDASASKATTIIDSVSAISGIQIGGITFDLENKTEVFSQARKLAFDKAKQKAEELASLSGVKLLKPVSISDTTQDISPSPQRNIYAAEAASVSDAAGAISSGQLEINLSISVVWGIE